MEPDDRARTNLEAVFQDGYKITIAGRHRDHPEAVDYHQCDLCFIQSMALALTDCFDNYQFTQLLLFLTAAPGEIDRNPNICIKKSA